MGLGNVIDSTPPILPEIDHRELTAADVDQATRMLQLLVDGLLAHALIRLERNVPRCFGPADMNRYRAAVPGSATRPLLFLDVDGPLIPFGGAPQQYPAHQTGAEPRETSSNPLLGRINPGHGARLTALQCDLVWATTWMTDANETVAPRIGLPQLAVVIWPEASGTDELDERTGLHWKTRALVDWAAGRPFAWVDDEITDTDRAWVSAHHRGHALLHRVDPRLGLTEADYAFLKDWSHWIRDSPPQGAA